MDRVRLGMVGGGRGAFIGPVHRIAARLDDHYELVAAALSSDPILAAASASDLNIDPARAYASYEAMAAGEAARADGIEAVSIVTPNNTHAAIAKIFLTRGIHVICDKPLSTDAQSAAEIVGIARDARKICAVTYNYTGYPMIRQAREMCASGCLGRLRLVQVEYLQDWLTQRIEVAGSKQAEWRTDPARSGRGGSIADIGTHAFNLLRFITKLESEEILAELSTFVEGRPVDDDALVLLRFKGGARGSIWASQVAPGNENDLSVRVFGDRGGLEWRHLEPNYLWYTPLGEPRQRISRGAAGAAAAGVTRIPAGHPEGYLEAFAAIYSEIAAAIRSARNGSPAPAGISFPTALDGWEGVQFVEAAIASSEAGAVWCDFHTRNTIADIRLA
ncbi:MULTISPECIES: Gfo/Idh/MocA family oxidoreductase [unclassified Mesorhizobium]|uniref:Gfo/Idh/MocA family protein n=1 Tax=unclassified Mesorhizobium TaxID=325217 RepID=UPI000F75C0FA|nr:MULTISPECIES: Gfo/Idh/MocA family oxidoreductase [unclassified Mesorhizobium]AZO05130.1 Gfo/Idh/MocA family oxidoreductase [Mesorhizobium sp. M2A.F.Ca.ET.043.02.1.1]RWB42903.1 MAG: Gfo/Idh/MocA family oxidoreductase [Mesorhizobium sp.]RWB64906.1 MAG: Gfo/Idh/MocA family oxidoreductase [Mesorhizobium sp.]RWB88134.1 MAG: Gfo/Idh/MocA family oxidoreductase [Mesorhizobium sp.]RWD77330.1 MAG: Gfo/Idh/MocA family oxidoreductase [Mesorhizobium sp.]